MPLMLGKKAVFAGDHKQLPPTVKSKEAERKGLGKTLFERLARIVEDRRTLETKIRPRLDHSIEDSV